MQSSQEDNQITHNQHSHKELEQKINQVITGDKQNLEIPQEDFTIPRFASPSGIQKTKEESHFNKPEHLAFAPFIASALKFQVNSRSFATLISYNEKHNLVISCFTNYIVQFFNADTWSNFRERTLEFPSYVVQVSFCSETDMFLFACANGNTYIYDFMKNNLTKHLKNEAHHIPGAEFIDPENYAFLLSETKRLYIGNLHYGVECGFRSSFLLENKNPACLHYLSKSRVLLVGLENGDILSIKMRRLNSAPNISILGSVCGSEQGKGITVIMSAVINGKEYLITGGLDRTMRIWNLIKGRMRLLRVIETEDVISKIVYLERYQMVAVTFRKNYMKFWRFVSGKLELKLVVDKKQQYGEVLLMKEKNTLGILNPSDNLIKLIQLHPCEDEIRKESE